MFKLNSFDKLKTLKILALLIVVAGFFSLISQTQASGVITGTVYIDYNMNGVNNTSGAAPNYAIDSGAGGVTVSAFDSGGVLRGTATSNSNGTYTLSASGTGPYRIEFTNLPAGYFPSEVGANNATSVRIVPDGNSSNIDFGIVRPDEYCQNNPDVITNVFAVGNFDLAAFAKFPYNYSDELDGRLNSVDPTNWTTAPSRTALLNPTGIGSVTQVGATFGVAFDARNNRFFASAYLKRGAAFGSLSGESTGAIYYVENPSATNPAINVFVDLNTVFGANTAGANSHPSATTTDWFDDAASIPLIGKRGLGGLKLSQDATKLYTVNLNDRRLYVIPTSGALNSTTIERYDIPTSGLATSAGNCNANDVRPFAIGRDRSGQIYVGAVCSAESESNNNKLHAYIWRFNGSTFTLVANNNLTFTRWAQTGESATWTRWANNLSGLNIPRPILTDIEFDGNDMILAIRDRYADQVVLPDHLRGYGDMMRVCDNNGTFVFENNGTCGGITTPVPPGGNANTGNGGREYYYDLNGDGREEGALGGLTQIPGYNHVLSAHYDPVTYNSFGTRVTNYYTAGVQRYNNTTGVMTGAYDVYLDADPGNFGKAGGVGDTEVLCNAAPLQIGNRVWNDANANGIQDANETGIQNVALQLWADTNGDNAVDTQIGAANSDASGNYIFGGAANSNLSNYTCGTTTTEVNVQVNASANDGYQLADGTIGDRLTRTFLPMGGVIGATGVRFTNLNIPQGATVTNAYIQFTADNSTASNSGSPTVTIRGQAADNATQFTTGSNNISNRPNTTASVNWSIPAWTSANQSGANQRTPALTSIVQEIVNRSGWSSGNAMVFKVTGGASGSRRDAESFDGNSGRAARLIVEYDVPVNCSYKLEPGTRYEVRIPATNFNSGQALNNFSPTAANADVSLNGTSRDSNGLSSANNHVIAPLTTGGIGANDHTIDFGFHAGSTYSIGNRIWFDTNNNGIIDAGEQGIGNITVSLFLDENDDDLPDDPDSPVQTVTTDADGYYRFDGLTSNNYIVRANPVNFDAGGRLERYRNTVGVNPLPLDSSGASVNAENGVNTVGAMNLMQTDGIISNKLTMNGTTAPLAEPDVPSTGIYAGQGALDSRADMTIDFGFYTMCLSGTLWNDTSAQGNNDGILNYGETGIPYVRVQLYDANGVEIPVGPDGKLGTADDAPGGSYSNSSGNYSFCGLPNGTYRVVVSGSGTSSTPTSFDPDDNIDHDDNGFPGTNDFAGRTVSGLVTLTPGNAGAQNNNTIDNTDGSTSNPTVDFGFIVAPSFVKLDGFDVFIDGAEAVIKWSTAEEFDNLGFNVYREVNGKRELINRAMIAGSSLKTTANLVATGDYYSWTDANPKSGAIYYLEDIDMKGNSTLHGPVSPKIKFSPSSLQKDALLLTDLSKTDNSSEEKEFVGRENSNESETPELNSSNGDRQRQIAARDGVKISVKRDAWYRVSAVELQLAGFNLNSNREFWQLFANGEEVPFKLDSDGSIEFFGTGNDKLTTDTKIYYLIEGSEKGQRTTEIKGGISDGRNEAQSFETTSVRKDRQIYLSAVLNNEENNFFGAVVTTTSPTSQTIAVRNLDRNGQITLRVKLQGLTTVNHLVSLRLNDFDLGTVSFANMENRAFEFDLPIDSISEGENQIQLQSVGTGNDISLVDSISLSYPRRYVAVDGKLRFTVPAGQSVRVSGFITENTDVFEIQNGRVERQVSASNETIDINPEFTLAAVGYDREFLAIEQDRTESAAKVERNLPSTLHSPKHGANFVIITHETLRESAETLAEIRQSQGLKTKVVSVDDIYDEFSFGEHSPEAIREFLRTASTRWQLKPGYVLLFGDSSYDPRNYLGQIDRDLVPTKLIDTAFQETGSDSWLADFDDDGIEEISLGRLPVISQAEANILLSKLVRYDNQTAREKSSVMIADRNFQYYNDVLQSELPAEVQASRIERSLMTDAQMHNQIVSQLNTGPMVVTYTGHGSTGLWAATSVFTINHVVNLNNEKSSIYLLMTCLNGFHLNVSYDSIAEAFLKKETGGAIAVWASSGTTYPDKQLELSRALTRQMFGENADTYRLGDLIRTAKQSANDLDAKRTWHLIGDPTIFVK